MDKISGKEEEFDFENIEMEDLADDESINARVNQAHAIN